jgi:hypothetical protein
MVNWLGFCAVFLFLFILFFWGYSPFKITYTSDYFDQLYEFALRFNFIF